MKKDPELPMKNKPWLSTGAVLAAIGASACCVGPFLLLSLGISGAWISTLTAMEPARPFFIILTLVFLVLGYRKLYQPPSCSDELANCSIPDIQSRQRRVFWISASLILMLLAFPWLAPFLMT
jgi:mercuric ion transport protein